MTAASTNILTSFRIADNPLKVGERLAKPLLAGSDLYTREGTQLGMLRMLLVKKATMIHPVFIRVLLRIVV